jgi:hypothetical protein
MSPHSRHINILFSSDKSIYVWNTSIYCSDMSILTSNTSNMSIYHSDPCQSILHPCQSPHISNWPMHHLDTQDIAHTHLCLRYILTFHRCGLISLRYILMWLRYTLRSPRHTLMSEIRVGNKYWCLCDILTCLRHLSDILMCFRFVLCLNNILVCCRWVETYPSGWKKVSLTDMS